MPGRPHLILAGCLLLLAGCGTGPVEVDTPDLGDLDPADSDVCEHLLDDLPETVDDAVRREVSPDDAAAAAWGQPAIVLRCGVAMPSSYRPDAQLHEVEGIGWLAEEGDGGRFFTAADRVVLVEVSVPDDYAPEATVLADLAPAILEHVPERPLP